jgi:hypothetical protein
LEIFFEPVQAKGPDGPCEMSQDEAMKWTTFKAACTGKAAAIRDMAEMVKEYLEGLVERDPQPPRRPIELVAAQQPDNADEALKLLQIAAPYAEEMGLTCIPLLVEPWAAQTAISRRRGGSDLTEAMRDHLRRLIRDPDSLRWPRGRDR